MPTVANRLLHSHIESVDGWLKPTAAYLSSLLLMYQRRSGYRGDLCEIGVYKGRYFIAMATLLHPTERAIAIDIFDDQALSRDTQGYAELGTPLREVRDDFEANCSRFLPAGQVFIIARPSTELKSQDLPAPCRFFSIDGGHSHDVVLNDLQLADSTISDEGIVAIDDIFNEQWPGVVSAFFDYLPHARFAPLALIPNKLLCCRSAMVEAYRNELRRIAPSAIWRRNVDFARHSVDLFRDNMTLDAYFGALDSYG